MPNQKAQPKATDIISKVAERIRTSDNVLVALSKDPSVDDLSAALGLTFMLDKIGKRATAIFSGAIPNAIEFLEPEKTFEANTDSLQDFIIALDKEKADHLRYKIEGDYVKVFITPYKTTIDERDMEFSHGDYNVDLVISLNVSDASDLDAALSEYGRIMHDATSINISAGVAGNFGDLEWGNPEASSVSEMIGELADKIKDKDGELLDKPISTALLAGIVAATNRFSNERTMPETMSLAARLMAAGADQQLISSSIPVEILTEDTVDATEDFSDAIEEDKSDEAPAADEAVVPIAQAESTSAEAVASVEAPAETSVEAEAPTPSSAVENSAQDIATTEEAAVEESVEETAPEPVEEVAPEPVKEADPTELEIRHGEVEFDPDEDLPEAERAKKAAAKAKEEEERQKRVAAEMEKHAPIEAAIAEINAKNAARLAQKTAPKAATPKASPKAPAAPTAPTAPSRPSSIEQKIASSTATAKATTKSPLISTVKSNSESGTDPKPKASEAENAKTVKTVAVSTNETKAEAELEANLAAVTAPKSNVLNELKEENDTPAAPKKKITPIGDVLARDDTPKNYAAMMENELSAPAMPAAETVAPAAPAAPVAPAASTIPATPAVAPELPQAPAMPVETPIVSAPEPAIATPLDDPNAAVFVDPNTVTDPQAAILPPPPAPFNPAQDGFLPPEAVAIDPSMATPVQFDDPSLDAGISAGQYVDGVQATNPVVENTPLMNAGSGGYLVSQEPQGANTAVDGSDVPTMPEVANNGYIVGEPAPAPAAEPASAEDPAAFHIPGM